MNLNLLNSNEFYFSFSVVFYGYAYLAVEKFIEKLRVSFRICLRFYA